MSWTDCSSVYLTLDTAGLITCRPFWSGVSDIKIFGREPLDGRPMGGPLATGRRAPHNSRIRKL
jgi:hypothetical protein